jgi:hypothetical protein
MLPRRLTIALASAALIGFESEAHAIDLKALVAKAAPSVVRVEVDAPHARHQSRGAGDEVVVIGNPGGHHGLRRRHLALWSKAAARRGSRLRATLSYGSLTCSTSR